MSLETEGSSAEAPETGAASTTPAAASAGSGYSATDPGYDADSSSPDDNSLEQLIAENKTTKKPSDASDDASETDGDTEETAETQPTADSAESDGLSDELLDRAEALGYTLAEIKGFSDGKSLEKEVSRVEKLNQRMQERQAKKSSVKEESAPVEEAKPEPKWDELIELGHDPDMIALQKETWQENQATKALLRQMQQAEQDRAWTAQCDRFDDSLNNLGEEYKTILGTGRRGELAKSSPEIVANRDKVFQKMMILRDGYQRIGAKVPPESELIQEAVQASFYKQAQTIARKALTRDIKKTGSQALSRPRSAASKPLSGPERALAIERDFWKERGE